MGVDVYSVDGPTGAFLTIEQSFEVEGSEEALGVRRHPMRRGGQETVVENVMNAVRQADVVYQLVPLHVGGGQRVKIPEGFSRKCPLVSTSLGAFGYEVANGRELLLADDPREFAAACISLIRDPRSAAQMAERAYRTFLERWTWDTIAPRVWAAAEDCLRRSSRQRSSAPQTRTDPAVSVGNPI